MGARNHYMRRGAWACGRLAVLGLVMFASACSTTQQASIQQMDIKCSFLGSDCDQLIAGEPGQAALRYVNLHALWTQYQKIWINPVIFWGSETTKVLAADQHMLTDYFHQVLREELGKKFELADQAGPGVMQLQVALTDVEGATRGLRTISMLWPQARVLNTLKYATTGTYAFIGGAQTEVKLTDAVSGQMLAEGMDKRIGGGSLEAAMQWQWGDAKNAMKAWAVQLADRVSSWTSGAVPPA